MLTRIGVLYLDERDIDKCEYFIKGCISANNETIVKYIKAKQFIEVETDRSLYKILSVGYNLRYNRWHKVFTCGVVKDDILNEVIYPTIIPYNYKTMEYLSPREESVIVI